MRKLIAFFLFLLGVQPACGIGEIVSLEVQKDGWRVKLTIAGFSRGATVNHGFIGAPGPNVNASIPGPATPVVTVTSQGYTGTTLGTKVRRVFLDRPMRFPYDTWEIKGNFLGGTFARHEVVTALGSGATGIFVGDQINGQRIYVTSIPDDVSHPESAPNPIPNGADLWQGTGLATFQGDGTAPVIVTPNPNEPGAFGTFDQRVNAAGNLVIEVPLSQYIYKDDNSGGGVGERSGVAPQIVIPANYVVNAGGGGQGSVAYSGVLPNSSEVAYRTVKFWWMWPDYQLVSTQVMPRAFAWAPHGFDGKPGIECVVFRVTDGSALVTSPQPVFRLEKDHTMPLSEFRNACVPTFIDILSIPTFIQAVPCSMNAIAYPQIGDTPYDTGTNLLQPEAIYGTQSFVVDRDGGYGRSYAVVDPVGGTDPSVAAGNAGKLVGGGTDPTVGTGTAFASIGRAARAITDYNNAAYFRNNVGGGVIYLQAGSYTWLGGSMPVGGWGYGPAPMTYVDITPYPGVARIAVGINNASPSGNADISDRIKLTNLTFTSSSANTITGCAHLWLDNVELNSAVGVPATVSPITGNGTSTYLTHCRLMGFAAGLKSPAGQTQLFPLIRGCEFAGHSNNVHVHSAVVGNYQKTKYVSGTRFVNRFAGYLGTHANAFLGFNNILGWEVAGSAQCFQFNALSEPDLNGFLMEQNVIEYTVDHVGSSGVGDAAAADGTSVFNNPVNDCGIEHNLFLGQRMQTAYNSARNTGLKERYYWQMRHSLWETLGLKSDDFSGGTPPDRDGIRQGNWPMYFGTGCAGLVNVDAEVVAGQSFPPYFIGIHGYDGKNELPANGVDWSKFKDRKASAGVATPGAGLGDYTLQNDSPLRNRQTAESYGMPYDMAGRRRRGVDAAGPYSQHKTVGRFTF